MQAKAPAQTGILLLAQLPRRICLRKCLRLLPSKEVKVLAHKQKISGRLHTARSTNVDKAWRRKLAVDGC